MYKIFTDGGYSSTRDQGGIAFIIFNFVNYAEVEAAKKSKENSKNYDFSIGVIPILEEVFQYSKTFKHTTNNRMEMLACIIALESIQELSEITLVSDSQYVIKTYTDNWKRKKNNDLWDRFDKAIAKHVLVKFEWTKGHANDSINNRCDALAVAASQKE